MRPTTSQPSARPMPPAPLANTIAAPVRSPQPIPFLFFTAASRCNLRLLSNLCQAGPSRRQRNKSGPRTRLASVGIRGPLVSPLTLTRCTTGFTDGHARVFDSLSGNRSPADPASLGVPPRVIEMPPGDSGLNGFATCSPTVVRFLCRRPTDPEGATCPCPGFRPTGRSTPNASTCPRRRPCSRLATLSVRWNAM